MWDPARRMQFRVGVNLGDVVADDTRVYGNGVNIAARLEAIAEPGGICISEKVRQEIKGKIDLACHDLGDQRLKNVAEPVRAHRIEAGAAPSASTRKPTLALPDKPSIAVLTFANMSGDQSQEYFSNGITKNIITELSRFSKLFIRARHSSFQYKGKSVDFGRSGSVMYWREAFAAVAIASELPVS